ncbi:kinase-like protein [Trametes coccinea BRFM310]|uniref:Kinase-like protein n=1 Tax=Trametes coccinea (strain BRFM310) TaxID=1353009 RepID=A0A1Y2IYB7_TRAC3|nr:kinase-like protein [Trametes coccinea BRFM310]
MPAQLQLPRRQHVKVQRTLTLAAASGHAPRERPQQRRPRMLAARSPTTTSPTTTSDPPSSGHNGQRVYMAKASDVIMGRYTVRGGIGFGMYGTVVRAEDNVTGTIVAIKVLHRDDDLHTDDGGEERMYEKILLGCNPHVTLFAQVFGSGNHNGFHCIVFELCHCTLYDVIQGYSGLMPLPATHIVEIAYQLVKGVQYLHSLHIVHTDIKLDNIGLKLQDTVKIQWLDPATGFLDKKVLVTSQIRILDLGNAVELQGRGVAHGRIGAFGYRAPEVVLGLPWSYPVDCFGMGCVIAELYLGHNLFNPDIEGDREYLAAVERLLGAFPADFAREVEIRHPGHFSFSDKASVEFPPLGTLLAAADYVEAMRRLERIQPLAALVHNALGFDFLCSLLCADPVQRATTETAAKHKYFDSMITVDWN